MFLSDNLFAKKGALAKIWLASHFERKLSKAQLIQTNIHSSVGKLTRAKSS
jgi:cohesin complex subunit SCC1